jgi:hypothetical protein
VVGRAADGSRVEREATTVDISPRGVAVTTTDTIAVGSIVRYVGKGYGFEAQGRVANSSTDRTTGLVTLGIEFLDGVTNPLVIWGD